MFLLFSSICPRCFYYLSVLPVRMRTGKEEDIEAQEAAVAAILSNSAGQAESVEGMNRQHFVLGPFLRLGVKHVRVITTPQKTSLLIINR